MFKVRLFVVLFALAGSMAACAPKSGTLQVTDVWARPGLAGGTSAVYCVVENETAWTDTLLSASSEIASAVELHMTTMQDGNMQMLPQSEVPIPSGKTGFEPGGLHVMLIGLNRDLDPGDTFTVTLDFATAGEMPLEVMVREP